MSSAPCGHADAYRVTMSVWGCPTCCELEKLSYPVRYEEPSSAMATEPTTEQWVTYLRKFPLNKPAWEWEPGERADFLKDLQAAYDSCEQLSNLKVLNLRWAGEKLEVQYDWHHIASTRRFYPAKMIDVLETYI